MRLKRSKKWTRFPTRLATIPQVRKNARLFVRDPFFLILLVSMAQPDLAEWPYQSDNPL
jgi:hypothetical protein